MSITVTGRELYGSGTTTTPHVGEGVWSEPLDPGVFINNGSAFSLRDTPWPSDETDTSGNWSILFPSASAIYPLSTKWAIHLPNGETYGGTFSGIADGSYTIQQLLDSHGWGVVTMLDDTVIGTTLRTYSLVQGPQGPTGPAGTADLLDGTKLTLVDEFPEGTAVVGSLGWQMVNSGSPTNGSPASVANHPGIYQIGTGTSSGNYVAIALGAVGGLFQASDSFDMTLWVRVDDVSSNTQLRVGALDTPIDGSQTSGIYLEKLYADTNWFAVGLASSTQTRVDTTVAIPAANTWTKIRVRRIDGTHCGITIDANTETVLTANLPTAGINPVVQIKTQNAGFIRKISVDRFQIQITGLSR